MAEDESGSSLRWVEIPIALPEVGQTATFEIEGLPLLLCHAEGYAEGQAASQAFVVRNECPHVQTSMEGAILEGTILECPLHGGRLDLRDGSPVAMPIRRAATCYPVRRRREGARLELGLPARAGSSRRSRDDA